MQYLLLMKFSSFGSEDYTKWQMFDSLEAAKELKAKYERQTGHYRRLPMIAPIMTECVILKVEKVEI